MPILFLIYPIYIYIYIYFITSFFKASGGCSYPKIPKKFSWYFMFQNVKVNMNICFIKVNIYTIMYTSGIPSCSYHVSCFALLSFFAKLRTVLSLNNKR